MILEILDRNWERIALTNRVADDAVDIREILGNPDSEASVSVPIDDAIVPFLPDPDSEVPIEMKFRVINEFPVSISPNLLQNSSFGDNPNNSVAGWSFSPSEWTAPHASLNNPPFGLYVARAESIDSSGISPLETTNKIAVDRTKDYTLSWYSNVISASSPAALVVELKEYNASNTFLKSEQYVYNQPTVGWVRHSMWMGPSAGGNRRAFHASTVQIEIEFWIFQFPAIWEVDAVQLEESSVPTAYRAKHGEDVNQYEILFEGTIDDVTKNLDSVSVSGKARGIELASRHIGRRDFFGWTMDEALREFTRDNIGRSPFATATASNSRSRNRPINAITGEVIKGQYWTTNWTGPKAPAISPAEWLAIDLGAPKRISGIRVIPPWWDNHYYMFRVYTGVTRQEWVLRFDQSQPLPAGPKGFLVNVDTECTLVKVEMYQSEDGYARLAGVMVYEDLTDIGNDTTYAVPWIENDDSRNITYLNGNREIQNNAWIGEGDEGNSFVTELNTPGAYASHKFLGVSDAVYVTQDNAGVAKILVDGVEVASELVIPARSYQYKLFDTGSLPYASHTLKVENVSGTVSIDYFSGVLRAAYRSAQSDTNDNFSFSGRWQTNYDPLQSGGSLKATKQTNALARFDFVGDSIRIISKKSSDRGRMNWMIDAVPQPQIDLYSPTSDEQQVVGTWSGTYGPHSLWAWCAGTKQAASSDVWINIDKVEGNWAHQVYLQSDNSTNLQMIQDLAEMTNSFLRLNIGGSIDLLSVVGRDTGEIIREGENEGGNITSADVSGDFSNMVSAIVAFGQGTENNALRVFVKDRDAQNRIGIKVGKLEHRNIPDAYMLTRLAWQALQEGKKPTRRYRIEYNPRNLANIRVGDTVRLYSPRLGLTGDEYRVFEKQHGNPFSLVNIQVANKRDSLSGMMTRTTRDLSVNQNTPQGFVTTSQYGGSAINFAAEVGGSTHRSAQLSFYIDDSVGVLESKLRVVVEGYRADVTSTQSSSAATHSHAQNYDIFKGPDPTAVSVFLDNININVYIGGPLGAGNHDGEITNILNTAGWHTLKFTVPSGTARVTPYVLVKTLAM